MGATGTFDTWKLAPQKTINGGADCPPVIAVVDGGSFSWIHYRWLQVPGKSATIIGQFRVFSARECPAVMQDTHNLSLLLNVAVLTAGRFVSQSTASLERLTPTHALVVCEGRNV